MRDHEREELMDLIRKTADTGIALAGPRKALDAALVAQHTCVTDFLRIVREAYDYAQNHGLPPILPLAPEVMQELANASGSMLLVCELMARGVLYEKDGNDHPSLENTPSAGRVLN